MSGSGASRRGVGVSRIMNGIDGRGISGSGVERVITRSRVGERGIARKDIHDGRVSGNGSRVSNGRVISLQFVSKGLMVD